MPHRTIFFDGHSVTVTHDHPAAALLLDFLFRDVENHITDSAEGAIRFRIIGKESDSNWELYRNDAALFRGPDINGLGNILLGEVLFHLIEHNRNGMALHAGLVSGPAGAWILPAESGSGKTSVTTWLLTRGYHYHTDELVILDPVRQVLSAFTRPLNVKTPGLDAIGNLVDLDAVRDEIRTSAMVTMIPHRLINPDYRSEVPALSAIIFPHYSGDTMPELQELSGAEAGLELMRSNVIARNLPGHGFGDVVQLVRQLPAYRLFYQHFSDLDDLTRAIG